MNDVRYNYFLLPDILASGAKGTSLLDTMAGRSNLVPQYSFLNRVEAKAWLVKLHLAKFMTHVWLFKVGLKYRSIKDNYDVDCDTAPDVHFKTRYGNDNGLGAFCPDMCLA